MQRIRVVDHLGVGLVLTAAVGFAGVGLAAAWVTYSVERHWASVGYDPVTCASLGEVEHYPPVSTIDVAGAGLFDYWSTPVWLAGGVLVLLAVAGAIDIGVSDRPSLHGRRALVVLGVAVAMAVGIPLFKHDTGCLIDVVHQLVDS